MSKIEQAVERLELLNDLRTDLRCAVESGNTMRVHSACQAIVTTWLGFDAEQIRIMQDALEDRSKQ